MDARRESALFNNPTGLCLHFVLVCRRPSQIAYVSLNPGISVFSVFRRIDSFERDAINFPWCAEMVQKAHPPNQPRCRFTKLVIVSRMCLFCIGMRLAGMVIKDASISSSVLGGKGDSQPASYCPNLLVTDACNALDCSSTIQSFLPVSACFQPFS